MRSFSPRTITAAALAVLLATFLVVEGINGRLWLNDFRVYWEASGRLLRGEAPYGEAFGLGSGFFKYAPACLLFFAPLAVLPYQVASIVWAVVVAAAIVWAVLLSERIVRERLVAPPRPFSPVIVALAVLAVVVHFHRELHLGNVNAVLLVILLVVANALLDGQRRRAGVLLGIALLVKPHFVVLLPLLLFYRRWRELALCVATVSVLTLAPAIVLGWERSVDLNAGWFRAMSAHNASFFHTGGENTRTAADTIHSVLWRLSGGMLPPTTSVALVTIALIAAAVGWFVVKTHSRAAGDGDAWHRDLLFAFLLLVALVPCLVPTDTEHFLFSLPLVLYLFNRLFDPGRPRWLLFVGGAVLLGYGGNWQDLWGTWSDVFADRGVLGAANAALIVLCAVLHVRKPAA